MTDDQLADLIAKPYKQPAAAMTLAAEIAATETIAHTRLAEEIDEYNWEKRPTE